MAKAWYSFFEGDPTSATNYYLMEKLNYYCLCGDRICGIYATSSDGKHPTSPLSANMITYIEQALGTGELQPQKPINGKKYVYLKY